MYLYHGSQFIIKKPVYHAGKPYNDYGYGFYCTENADVAAEWSVTPEHNGYVNKYEIDEQEMSILDLSGYTVMAWLAILLENRTFEENTVLAREAKRYILKEFPVEYESYDLIKGYRADDSYFSFAQDFLNGRISYEQLSKAMKLGKLGQQVVIKSNTAFEKIRWIDASEAKRENWLAQKEERDRSARIDYSRLRMEHYQKGSLYVTKFLDEEITKDDARL
ncbi:MAG: DUF3990 domain-containing protein [Saccharofermentans sp.]|nr:DUF3990 domain-containing protein [Saccharofermentans sp.]